MKIIYVNCSGRNEYGSDPHRYEHHLSSSAIWSEKKSRPVRDLNL